MFASLNFRSGSLTPACEKSPIREMVAGYSSS
jgi:hypothetical protein